MEVADQTSKKMTVQSYRGLRMTFKQWISFILAVATMEIHFSRRVIMKEEPLDFPVGCQIARSTSVLPRKKEKNLTFDPGWKGCHGFQNLHNKCLVELDSKNNIHMHDHLRDMGRDIAKDSNLQLPLRVCCSAQNIHDLLQQSHNAHVPTAL
jgi:hypothetical protein